MHTVVTQLNEEAEEMGKMKQDKRKQVSDQTDLQCSQPGCTFTTQNKAGLVNHHDRNTEQQPKRSSLVITATKTLNSKVIAII